MTGCFNGFNPLKEKKNNLELCASNEAEVYIYWIVQCFILSTLASLDIVFEYNRHYI